MNPVDWLRELGTLVPRPWGRDCPHGSPVPVGPCPDCDAVALTDVEERATVRVSCLSDPGHPAAIRLASAGVLPGAEVTLLQRWPAFVMRLGYTELAMDRETARMIRVRHESPDAKTPLHS